MTPSDDAIRAAMEGINIGNHEPVALFKNALLQVAVGYWVGSTMQHHLQKFDLIAVNGKRDEIKLVITPLGRDAVLEWFQLKE